MEDGVLTRDALAAIRAISRDANDDDSALLPEPGHADMTIDGELQGVDLADLLSSGITEEEVRGGVGFRVSNHGGGQCACIHTHMHIHRYT